jgi:23S rRNA (uridine2552-2'-O)-methyltransferase
MDQWLKQRKGEFFYKKAKAEKYRARSAYKLLELQKKFHFIGRGNIVVDLGAAPGSWSQVALQFVGPNGKVIGVDIKPVISLGNNYESVLGDIFKDSTIVKIKQKLNRAADVVISDVAPEFSGIRTRDIGIAMLLSFRALQIAKKILKQDGIFVTKAFHGVDYEAFVSEIKKSFAAVKIVKPLASLRESAEVYIIGLRFRKGKQPSEKRE